MSNVVELMISVMDKHRVYKYLDAAWIQNEKSTITGVGATSSSDVETCEDCLKRSFSDCFSKMWFHRRLPCTKWIPQYSASYLLRDFIAGITVGLTAIPQGIAYANVAGLQPQYGLYSTIMPCFLYILLGGCKDMTLGPTAIMALMTYPHASKYGPAYSVLLCFLSGVIIMLLSILQLGSLVDFISLPVTVGFTAAAAFTIASAQIKNFLGLKVKSSNEVVDSWFSALTNLDKISWPDTLLGCATIVALLLGRYIKSKSSQYRGEGTALKFKFYSLWLLGLSGNAIVVITGSLLAYCLSQENVSPFILTGNVTGGLPDFHIPPFSTQNQTFSEMVSEMGSTVMAAPLISIMETIAIGKAFEKGKGVDATQEMIVLGISNVAGSFLGSMPISGSFTRSAVNNSSGVKTPFGGFFTGTLVLLALSFLTSLFYYIPKATLAGLIITAMIFMVEYHTIAVIWRTKKSDMIPLSTAFFFCLFFGIEIGMVIGIAVNLCVILYGISKPSIQISWLTVGDQRVLYVLPKENVLFPATGRIREVIIEECTKRDDYSPVIIDGSHIYRIDSSTSKGLSSLNDDLRARGQRLVLWKWNDIPVRTFLSFDDRLKWSIRFDDSLDRVINGKGTNSVLTENEKCNQ
ncbi:hypothetical protein V9T40_009261 [Parthenolecanium corni]|uniref:STAS domain-containing protein n=1 Tax=Parthenolecanium corni TaxID=536013 RepID=A0AAN9Y8V9_9HEMI